MTCDPVELGDLAAMRVTFEQHCNGAAPALRGSLRYHAVDGSVWTPAAPIDDSPAEQPPGGTAGGEPPPG